MKTTEKRVGSSILWTMQLIVAAVFLCWMVVGSFPTGWIYDLWAGTGTAAGQKPGVTVVPLTNSGVLENRTIWYEQPFTVTSDTFVQTPLVRLRDPDEAGLHRGSRKTGNTAVTVSEYRTVRQPMGPVTWAFYHLGIAGSYNSYQLVQLEDGSYICAFFDDYRLLGNVFGGPVQLPTGYVRLAEQYEIGMLKTMAEAYPVSTQYVLDMYDYDKMAWWIDKPLRLVLACAVLFVWFYFSDRRKSRKKQ